jgi:L-lactate dehydrogenase complex protein LldF
MWSFWIADLGAREALQCIRCGACQNACPVYRSVGGHSYGGAYAGPIGAIVSPFLDHNRSAADLPFASTLCGACADVCPVKIRIPEVLLHLRANIVTERTHGAPLTRRMFAWSMRIWAALMSTRRAYQATSRVLRWAAPLVKLKIVRQLPGPMRGWSSVRTLPRPAETTFTEWWQARSQSSAADRPDTVPRVVRPSHDPNESGLS